MDNEMLEKYKAEMLKMYEKAKKNSDYIPVQATNETNIQPPQNTQTGGLLGVVTSFRSLYPVENAKITVFSGNVDDMKIIDTDFTDRSGRTKVFTLTAPDKNLSMSPDLAETPYSSYNMAVEADGFLTNIHLNIPIFSSITSIQRSDMIIDADQSGSEPQIFDEGQKYNL